MFYSIFIIFAVFTVTNAQIFSIYLPWRVNFTQSLKCSDPNAEFAQNGCQSGCPSLCSGKPLICDSKECEPGCQCKEGYVRHDISRQCVLPEMCSSLLNSNCQRNDPNSEWKQCRDNCPPTCSRPESKCPKICQYAGCECKSGYVLDDSNPLGTCVLAEECRRPPNRNYGNNHQSNSNNDQLNNKGYIDLAFGRNF